MNCNWRWAPGFWIHGGSFFWTIMLALLAFILGVAVWKMISARASGIAGGLSCYHCNNRIEYSYMRCPHCGNELKGHCLECSGIIETTWKYCPSCSADLKRENIPNE